MRWLLFVLLATIYAGGIVGSFEFFKARFGCSVLKDIDSTTCGAGVWINAASWPFNIGRELARWSYENEGDRQKKSAIR
jgi:hypothetical protein